MKPSVGIVALTHNRVELLRQCVENVLLRTTPLTTEIVVWNNASTDGTREFLDGLDDPRFRMVHSKRNVGLNGYAKGFALLETTHLVELDDDLVDAPHGWDRTLLEAFDRLPEIGFLAADLEDDPYDVAAHYRYRVRPHLYSEFELHGITLLDGPAGGGCAMTSRDLYDLVGGFPEKRRAIFFQEEGTYIKRLEKKGFRKAVLRDLRVKHTGGPHYAPPIAEKDAYWKRLARRQAQKDAIKGALCSIPPVRSLNRRFDWFVEPER
jgi:GT2 family glycosyltransferase